MVRANSKRKSDDMKKIKFILLIFFSVFYLNKIVISAEIDIYKKIDLFGEVLEKINNKNLNFFISSLFLLELALTKFSLIHKIFFFLGEKYE